MASPRRGWRTKEYWTQRGAFPRWQLLVVYVGVVAVTGFGIAVNRDIAEDAKDHASRAHKLAIDATFQREKICSETNREACSALLDRLIPATTLAQRRRIACDLMFVFDDFDAARRRAGCPIPTPPRPPISFPRVQPR